MRVFITGGLTGMGLELSKHYLKRGDIVGVSSFEAFDDIKANLLPNVQYFQADVTKHEQMEKVIKEFAKKNNGLDLVVANAGITHLKSKIPDFERGRRVIETNVIGVLNTFGPAIEIMKEQGSGHLAALSSISAFAGLPGMSIYGASKAAVLSLCESMAIDLASYGIKVSAIAPGFVKTDIIQNNKHKMPFLMEKSEAALKIFNALEAQKTLYIFPLPMKVIAQFLKHVPRFIYKPLMKKDYLGLSKF